MLKTPAVTYMSTETAFADVSRAGITLAAVLGGAEAGASETLQHIMAAVHQAPWRHPGQPVAAKLVKPRC